MLRKQRRTCWIASTIPLWWCRVPYPVHAWRVFSCWRPGHVFHRPQTTARQHPSEFSCGAGLWREGGGAHWLDAKTSGNRFQCPRCTCEYYGRCDGRGSRATAQFNAVRPWRADPVLPKSHHAARIAQSSCASQENVPHVPPSSMCKITAAVEEEEEEEGGGAPSLLSTIPFAHNTASRGEAWPQEAGAIAPRYCARTCFLARRSARAGRQTGSP